MQEPSIFTHIVNGTVPAHKVFEDEHTLAFLDIHPLQPGHTLVIPKKQVEFVWDLDDETYHHVMATAKRVALVLRERLGVPYVSQRIVGVDVPHAHVQLIPFSSPEQLAGVQDMVSEPDHELLASIAQKLSF